MAYEIKIHEAVSVHQVRAAILANLDNSRFVVSEIEHTEMVARNLKRTGVTAIISLHQIRLRKSKHYCGSHPGACQTNDAPKSKYFGGGKTKTLEGADWIAFNDMINDALDSLRVSADVETFVCVIRRKRERRIRYSSFRPSDRITNEWLKEGEAQDFADFCGRPAPATEYPEGTPGLVKWRVEEDVQSVSK